MDIKDTNVVPGMLLCEFDDDKLIVGDGCYVVSGHIRSTCVGSVSVCADTKDQTKFVVSVANSWQRQVVVPQIGDIVTGQITTVNPRMCKLEILAVNEHQLDEPFRAVLRKEDVRVTDKDAVEMYKCFRGNDILLARVISLGESNTGYLVSTAENELGVVSANSAWAGVPMVPISWTQMQCPVSGIKEGRKLAKVVPENVDIAEFADKT